MRVAPLLAAWLALGAGAAQADGFDASRTPAGAASSLPGGWRPEAGGWVMYKVTAPNLDAPKLFRLACTGTEALGEKGRGYWLEMADAEPGRGSVMTRMLLVGDRRDRAAMKRLMIWAPPQPPFEIPPAELAATDVPADRCTSDPDVGPVCGGGRKQALGTRTLQTPAGALACRGFKVRKAGGVQVEQWLSARVPLIGLVRMTTSEGASWELVDMGRDATTRFPADVAVIDLAGLRKFSEQLEKATGTLQPGDLRDEAHGATDPLEGGGAPLPP